MNTPIRRPAARPSPGMAAPATALRAAGSARRSDGHEARRHLLHSALALFAEKGFAKTSTREIAQAAGANVAAISYYFGDKAGLYAACFGEPMCNRPDESGTRPDDPALTLHEALRLFLTRYVEPLKQGEVVRQCMALRMRELLEPTGQWAEELERDIQAPHRQLVAILSRHLGVKADEDVHRLAFAIAGLALQLFVTRDYVEAIKPSLVRSAASIDRWAERLVRYALALVEAEARHRADAAAAARPSTARTARSTVTPIAEARASSRG